MKVRKTYNINCMHILGKSAHLCMTQWQRMDRSSQEE